MSENTELTINCYREYKEHAEKPILIITIKGFDGLWITKKILQIIDEDDYISFYEVNKHD